MLRRLFARRFIRVLLWIFITLVTLLVLLFVWTNWSGRRRWAATNAALRQAGESLDFQTLLAETPPGPQNLLAIGPLEGIAAVVERDASKGAPAARRRALEALKLPASPKAPAQDGVTFGRATDFQEWAGYLQRSKFIDLPAAALPDGRAVLTALDAKFPVLKQLADATVVRPRAMFTPGMREREKPVMLFAMPMPHYNAANQLGRGLGLRARTAVAAGEGAEAARSIVAITRLAHACREESLLLGFLVGASLEAMAVEPLWQGLREHVFAAEDLRRLQLCFGTDETTQPLLRAMRGELVAGVEALTTLQASPSKEALGVDINQLWGHGLGGLVHLIPRGLFDHWKSALAEMELRLLIEPLKKGLIHGVRAGEAAQEEAGQYSNHLLHPDRMMANVLIPTVSSVNSVALLVEVRRRQAFTAIALEQFFLKQGKFPAKLEELVPEFLAGGIPPDPCDEKPLRYSLPASGSFRLWSVGMDETDDGGKVTVDETNRAKLSKRGYRGDWAWQYEPVAQ